MKRKRLIPVLLCILVAAGLICSFWSGFFGSSYEAPAFIARLSNPANQLPDFSRKDSVLIVAPHPDDECIATGGLIQRALSAGSRVHVLYLTYGDNHELAYWALRKIPALTPRQYRSLGETRRKEALKAMTALGLPSSDLTFLGYPDSGTLRIWSTTWKPGTSRFHAATGTRSVPYADALTPEAPYNAVSILNNVETVMRSCKPTIIIFPSSLDLNPDHQAAYLFTTAALLDLNMTPMRYLYLVHQHYFPLPRFYNPYTLLVPPDFVAQLPVTLRNLKLSLSQTTAKYHATLLYHSQIEVSRQLLVSFSRQNEVYLLDRRLSLSGNATSFFSIPGSLLLERLRNNFSLRSASAIWLSPQTLRLELSFSEAPSSDSVIALNIFPFASGTPFATQPKLAIILRYDKKPVIRDLVTGSSVTNTVQVQETGSRVTIDVQTPSISRATTLMLHVGAKFGGLNLYNTPWQTVSLPTQ